MTTPGTHVGRGVLQPLCSGEEDPREPEQVRHRGAVLAHQEGFSGRLAGGRKPGPAGEALDGPEGRSRRRAHGSRGGSSVVGEGLRSGGAGRRGRGSAAARRSRAEPAPSSRRLPPAFAAVGPGGENSAPRGDVVPEGVRFRDAEAWEKGSGG